MKKSRVFCRLLCVMLAGLMVIGLLPARAQAADGSKLDAYAAYLDYMTAEVESLGGPVRDQDYYKMFTNKCKNACTQKILAAYLLDVTNDGIEELFIKRYVTHESSAMIDFDDCEWICIYSYVDGHLKRIGQNQRWAKDEGNGSWSYYEPKGYIGDILSSHEYPNISNDVVYYCTGSNGKVYLADREPTSIWGETLNFYSYKSSVMKEYKSFSTIFIPDWQIGSIESDYGRYSYEVNGETTDEYSFMDQRDRLIAGGYKALTNNDYTAVMHKLSTALEAYYTPSNWAKEGVNEAIALGYVPEGLQKNYTAPITRGEFCALATLYYEAAAGREIEARMQFTDTSDVNIQKMGGLGIVNGVGGGAFAPKDLLTRQEAATILNRLADALGMNLPAGNIRYADDSKISKWAKESVSKISEAGVMNGVGDNKFSPLTSYTREQAIVTILRLSKISVGEIAPEPEQKPGPENFKKVNTYRYNFSDMPGNWADESIIAAYEYGLVNGYDGKFNPNGNITLAETLTIACRLHEIYNGGDGVIGQSTSPWYQVYVNYAIDNGIIDAGSYSDYDVKATRAQFAQILARALPEEALPAINTVEAGKIPDVTGSEAYADSVYLLYNAGVLTGSDGGKFYPASSILRCEVAAIVARMADPTLRKNVNL